MSRNPPIARNSEAAEAFRKENRQRVNEDAAPEDDLTSALEDTFPASDPLSSETALTPGKPARVPDR